MDGYDLILNGQVIDMKFHEEWGCRIYILSALGAPPAQGCPLHVLTILILKVKKKKLVCYSRYI